MKKLFCVLLVACFCFMIPLSPARAVEKNDIVFDYLTFVGIVVTTVGIYPYVSVYALDGWNLMLELDNEVFADNTMMGAETGTGGLVSDSGMQVGFNSGLYISVPDNVVPQLLTTYLLPPLMITLGLGTQTSLGTIISNYSDGTEIQINSTLNYFSVKVGILFSTQYASSRGPLETDDDNTANMLQKSIAAALPAYTTLEKQLAGMSPGETELMTSDINTMAAFLKGLLEPRAE